MPKVTIGVKETENGWCGVSSEGFTTDGWPTREIAIDRIRQHRREVEQGVDPGSGLPVAPMEPLSEFRARWGLEADGKRAVLIGADIIPDEES